MSRALLPVTRSNAPGNLPRSRFGTWRSVPACGGVLVARARVDPALSRRSGFLFPERCARLEVIHDELARGERFAAMRARDGDHHDLVRWREFADTVNHERVEDVPARLGSVDDAAQCLFGHRGIV